MATIQSYLADTTPVTSFTLQTRDWEGLGTFMVSGDEAFDPVVFELRNFFNVEPPPTNQTNLTVTKLTVGLITALYLRFYPNLTPLNNAAKNRVIAAITTAGATVPALLAMIADYDAYIQTENNAFQQRGRKRLRAGKTD